MAEEGNIDDALNRMATILKEVTLPFLFQPTSLTSLYDRKTRVQPIKDQEGVESK